MSYEHDLAGSPGPRGLVLAHPFEGKYYDYRDHRVSFNLTICIGPFLILPPICWATLCQTPFATTFGFGKIFCSSSLGGDISQRDKNGCKCQTTKGQIS